MKDKTIAILENRAGEQLADLIRKHGGQPFSAPALSEIPDIDLEHIKGLIIHWQLEQPDIFVFQTGVGVKALFASTDALGVSEDFYKVLALAKVVVRGVKPQAALRSRNIQIDLSAKSPFTTSEVLDELDSISVANKLIVVQRYGDTNWELQTALKLRRARVTEIATYRWSLPEDINPLIALIDALSIKAITVTCFTSASQVQNLFTVAAQFGRLEELLLGLKQTIVASIGPVCSKALNKFLVRVDVEPDPPKLGPFITAINNKLEELNDKY